MVIEIRFYPNCTVLMFDDGHSEVIPLDQVEYVQEEMN
jgi:hypothetical protein